MAYKDPEKAKEQWRRWYAANAKRHIATGYARRKAVVSKFREWKSTLACMHCGENEPICLEFHHVDPATKDGTPTDMAMDKGWSFDRLRRYLSETCLVLCANCHRKVHKRIRELAGENPDSDGELAA